MLKTDLLHFSWDYVTHEFVRRRLACLDRAIALSKPDLEHLNQCFDLMLDRAGMLREGYSRRKADGGHSDDGFAVGVR
jgi:hypothetical protein